MKAGLGDIISLAKQQVKVVKCEKNDELMVNLDTNHLAPGDLTTLKQAGVSVSNPDTDKPICIHCEYRTMGRKVADFFESDDDDDSSFFGGGSTFGGGWDSDSDSGSSFGGFGGGSFSGGGASSSW